MSKYDDLVKKLKEIFQIDRPELDFGVYRILNARVGEINDYLENRLKAKVQDALAKQVESDSAFKLKELTAKIREEYGKRVFDEQGNLADDKVKESELGQQLVQLQLAAPTAAEHENAVFTHLLTFFSRYYDQGDFISQRRYKGDTYAIPYAGEEVVLHWANKDQYYTKSGENFSNYGFKLDDGRTVRFRLVIADTAKDNRKDNDKERLFVLIEPHTRTIIDDEGDEYEETLLPVTEDNGELVLLFEYKVMAKGSKQDALVLVAVKKVLDDENVKVRWLDLGKREPTEKNPQRTLLEKCLTSYTTKNTADYFIHKDLGGFLRRELDFYIKNEVMNLDDVQNAEKFADIEKNLRLIQTLRAIALDLITFLAQLEDFQKKLWLKKKFVVATHYCMTLDRVPENLYPEIAANSQQWDQWKKLGMLEGNKVDLFKQAKTGSVEYLKTHQFLMVDTALFDAAFKYALLAAVDNLDENLDGLLIYGDNYQALSLLQERYRCSVAGIYIDPPYNTDASPIVYKNGYQHSSWASLFSDRMAVAMQLLRDGGMVCVAIDDFEYPQQYSLMGSELGFNHTGTAVVRSKPQGRPTQSGFSANHEYAVFWSLVEKPVLGRLPRKGSKAERYPHSDDKGIYSWANFRKSGTDSDRDDRKKSFYPLYIHEKNVRVPNMEWNIEAESWDILEQKNSNEVVVWPIDKGGNEKVWTCSAKRLRCELSDLKVIPAAGGAIEVQKKYRPNQDGALPGTWWESPEYSASESGTKVLKDQFKAKDFDFPKSINLVIDNLRVLNIDSDAIVIDYFAGSGTTACATISLNREDKGSRKYILIEQGEYFDTVLKPRLQKVVYSADWKDGKATAPQTGISHAFKVLKLESYEDALNNLQLRRSEAQQSLLDTLPKPVQEDYLLNYMLDIESRSSLLSVEQFNQPFDCKLKVTVDSAGAYEERTIDLVETFNYLIGLRVKHIDMQRDKGFVSVTGWLPTGEKTLVLWRDVVQVDYESMNRLCDKLAINPADSEFEIVYINGDHNIPAVFTSTEAEGGITKTLKIRQIEPEFLSRMFAVEGV
jgi:adenine-specific DNA-methyltransferase